jgi:P pilus assembly chaperone PapD
MFRIHCPGAARFAALIFATWVIHCGDGAQAMSVTPLSVELTSSGASNKATLRVHNNAAAPIPVEFQITRITIDEKGATRSEPAPDQFVIFPPQKAIPPGATQSFRVQWLGTPNLKQSETYIISVNQLPVDLGASKSGVQMVYNFSVIVNVAPMNAKSAVELVSADIVTDKNNVRRPRIRVKNSGNRHALLSDGSILLSGGGWPAVIGSPDLRAAIGLGLIQPGKTRNFVLGTEIPKHVPRLEAQLRHTNTN